MTEPTPRPRALVTLPDVPVPADSGRRLRSWSVLVGLSRHYDLDVVLPLPGLFDDGHEMPPDTSVRRTLAVAPRSRFTAGAARAAVRGRVPWTIAHDDWSSPRARIASWCREERYDLLWFGGTEHHRALSDVVDGRHSIVDFDDVQSVKWRVYLESRKLRSGGLLDRVQRTVELPLWERLEKEVAAAVDAVLIADPDDAQRCAALGIENAEVVPNSYPNPGPLPAFSPSPEPVVVLVANFAHDPNRDAAQTLVDRILPRLRSRRPGARVRLIGRSPEVVSHLGRRPGVDVVGAVDDIGPHVTDAVATLLPITYGGGTRLKALEAFALGVPVVSTEFGVAGLHADAGASYLRAETPDEFVEHTIALMDDAALAPRLRSAARLLYETHFTTSASSDSIARLVSGLA